MTTNCERCGGKGYLGDPGGPDGSVAIPCPDCQRVEPSADTLEARLQECLARIAVLEADRHPRPSVAIDLDELGRRVSKIEEQVKATIPTKDQLETACGRFHKLEVELTSTELAVDRLRKSKCILCGKKIGGTVVCNDCRVENIGL